MTYLFSDPEGGNFHPVGVAFFLSFNIPTYEEHKGEEKTIIYQLLIDDNK